MESKLANYAELQLVEVAKRMTHEQRLRAFIEHSKRMVQLQRAAKSALDESTAGSKASGAASPQ